MCALRRLSVVQNSFAFFVDRARSLWFKECITTYNIMEASDMDTATIEKPKRIRADKKLVSFWLDEAEWTRLEVALTKHSETSYDDHNFSAFMRKLIREKVRAIELASQPRSTNT